LSTIWNVLKAFVLQYYINKYTKMQSNLKNLKHGSPKWYQL